MQKIMGGEEEFQEFLKKLSGKDRLTLKFYWKKANRIKRILVIKKIARGVGIYLLPLNYDFEKPPALRWQVGYMFTSVVDPKKTFLFTPPIELETFPIESSPLPIPTPTKRKRGRPKKGENIGPNI